VRGRWARAPRPPITLVNEERKKKDTGGGKRSIMSTSRRRMDHGMNAIKSPKRGGSCTAWCGEAGERTDEEIQEDEGGSGPRESKKAGGPFRFVVSSARRRFFRSPPSASAYSFRAGASGRRWVYVGCMGVGVVLYRSLCDCSSPGAEKERKE